MLKLSFSLRITYCINYTAYSKNNENLFLVIEVNILEYNCNFWPKICFRKLHIPTMKPGFGSLHGLSKRGLLDVISVRR